METKKASAGSSYLIWAIALTLFAVVVVTAFSQMREDPGPHVAPGDRLEEAPDEVEELDDGPLDRPPGTAPADPRRPATVPEGSSSFESDGDGDDFDNDEAHQGHREEALAVAQTADEAGERASSRRASLREQSQESSDGEGEEETRREYGLREVPAHLQREDEDHRWEERDRREQWEEMSEVDEEEVVEDDERLVGEEEFVEEERLVEEEERFVEEERHVKEERIVEAERHVEEELIDESYADESYADESYADESYADESYADESYADESYVDESPPRQPPYGDPLERESSREAFSGYQDFLDESGIPDPGEPDNYASMATQQAAEALYRVAVQSGAPSQTALRSHHEVMDARDELEDPEQGEFDEGSDSEESSSVWIRTAEWLREIQEESFPELAYLVDAVEDAAWAIDPDEPRSEQVDELVGFYSALEDALELMVGVELDEELGI